MCNNFEFIKNLIKNSLERKDRQIDNRILKEKKIIKSAKKSFKKIIKKSI